VGKTYVTGLKSEQEYPLIHLGSSGCDLKSSAGTVQYVKEIAEKARGSPNSVVLVIFHAEASRLLRDEGSGVRSCIEVPTASMTGNIASRRAFMTALSVETRIGGLLKEGITEWDVWAAREATEQGPKIVLGKG
jgi:hypothetical protein